MNKKRALVSILMGAALILSALFLYRNNQQENRHGEHAAGAAVQGIRNMLDDNDGQEAAGASDLSETELSDEMPEVIIDGYAYIGYLSIPDLNLELPVMTDWDDEKLKISPCRQFGSTRTNDLVIAAHNYDAFFGRLRELTIGAEVMVTDMDGIVNRYTVKKMEVLAPTAVESVENSGYGLVLYTCTYGGQNRVTVFCDLQDP